MYATMRFYLLNALVLRRIWNYKCFSVYFCYCEYSARVGIINRSSVFGNSQSQSIQLEVCSECFLLWFSVHACICFFSLGSPLVNLQPPFTKNTKYLSVASCECRFTCAWILLTIVLIFPFINFVPVSLVMALIVLFK